MPFLHWRLFRRLLPAGAQIEWLERRLRQCNTLLQHQTTLIQDQSHALHQLQAALLAAQFEAEGWRLKAQHQQHLLMRCLPTAQS